MTRRSLTTQLMSDGSVRRSRLLVFETKDDAPADNAQHAATAAVSASAPPPGSLRAPTSAANPDSAAAARATASAPFPVVTSDSSRSTAHSVGESSLLWAAA